MLYGKLSKKLALIFLLSLFSISLQIEIAAQCGGTYFKRTSLTHTSISGYFNQTADMNNDGFADVLGFKAQTQTNDRRNKFIILPGNADGSLGEPNIIDLGAESGFFQAVLGDVDGDNRKDIFMRFYSGATSNRVYKNNGDGTFTPLAPIDNLSTSVFYLVDINNDGKGDLITSLNNGQARYHLGNGDGTFQDSVAFAGAGYLVWGDFNVDGKIDFVIGNNLILNQGNLVFTNTPNVISLSTDEYIRNVRDYNGDGRPDFISYEPTNGRFSVFINSGNNSFQRTDYPITIPPFPFDQNGNIYFGNFSGDAKPDFIYSSYLSSKTVIFTNNGAGDFSQRTYNYTLGKNTLADDFDGDGKTDSLVVSNAFEFNVKPKLFSESTLTFKKNVCNPVGETRVVDFDGSGTTDFSYWTPANGKWSYLPSFNTNGVGSVSFFWGAGSFGDIPTPGDFDGDGKTDYAVYRNSTGVWWIRRSSDQQTVTIQFGLPDDKPVVGDYDGDSVSDIAVWRPSDGVWYVWSLRTQQFFSIQWGLDGDKPVPEDYDGDSKTDVAVFRPSTGVWYYQKSSDASFNALQFGLGTDRPVPSDYDGDGKADIAVYRNSNNVFHFLRSYNSQYYSYLFGSSGDVFQPGDYDGDFVTDLSFYRPSTKNWRVFYQTSLVSFGDNSVVPTSTILRTE